MVSAANRTAGELPQRNFGSPVPVAAPAVAAPQQKISGAFQLLLALYIILTSNFPTILQSVAFGVQGGAWSEFAFAMATQTLLALLLIAPVIVLANHPLGILHPLLLAIVVWPLLTGMANTVEDLGGWAGVLAGTAVQTPYYTGLLSHSPSVVWAAVTKYNVMQILNLLGIYFGFSLWRNQQSSPRGAVWIPDPVALRPVLIGLIAASTLVLAVFVQSRGGLVSHLMSLGRGRFRELAGDGPIIVLAGLGLMPILLWTASRPRDVRLPLFLACAALVTASQFISNGSRSSAIETPMLIGIVWAVRTRRVPWRIAILLGPVLFLAIGSLSVIRNLSRTNQTVNEVVSKTGVSQSFANAQSEIASRQAESAPVPVVARGFKVTGGPLLGTTYVAALTAAIPRALWEGKPRGVGSIYSQLFRGASRDAGSTPVSSTAEMYWNFGVFGVAILSICYGMLLRLAYKFLWRRYPNPFAMVFYVIFLTVFDVSSKKLVDFQQAVGLLLLCYFVVRMIVPKIYVRRVRSPLSVRPATPYPRTLPSDGAG